MKDLRRSWHCRRLFFRHLRQKDKGKQAEKQLNVQTDCSKPNPQFDKFNHTISAIIVATIFIGFIFIFIYYYITLACLVVFVLEFLIMIIGAMHYGNKERKQEESEPKQSPIQQAQKTPIGSPKTNLTNNLYVSSQNKSATMQTFIGAEPAIVLEPFDMLTGIQFKDLIEKYFNKKGYTVNRITPRVNSIDFLIEKDCAIMAVATKRTFDLIQKSYISNVIESVKMYKNVLKIIVITTSMYFMPQAQQLANENGITLWNREALKSQLGGLE